MLAKLSHFLKVLEDAITLSLLHLLLPTVQHCSAYWPIISMMKISLFLTTFLFTSSLTYAEGKYSMNSSVECAATNHQSDLNDAYSSEPRLPSSISYLPSPTAAAVSPASIQPIAEIVNPEVSADDTNIALIGIEWAPVGDPANDPDIVPGRDACGAVEKPFQIGKYEVTAAQYNIFLNAVAAKKDPHGLYKEAMASDQKVACITRIALPEGGYSYAVIPGREKLPITYVSLYDAERFCNWLTNGSPTSAAGKNIVAASTEHGAYNFKKEGDQEIVEINPEAPYHLPSDNEWVKAAYYKGKGTHSGYWAYPAQYDFAPNSGQGDETNQANYKTYAATTWYNFGGEKTVITPVDHFSKSVGPYGTYDMGGNVAEWTSSVDASSHAIVRGGSWKSEYSIYWNNELMRTAVPKSYDPSQGTNFIGFRVVSEERIMTSDTTTLDDNNITPFSIDISHTDSETGFLGSLSAGATLAAILIIGPLPVTEFVVPFIAAKTASLIARGISPTVAAATATGMGLAGVLGLGVVLTVGLTGVFYFNPLLPPSVVTYAIMQGLYVVGNPLYSAGKAVWNLFG